MKPVTIRSTAKATFMAMALVAASSCGSELMRSDQSPGYLVIKTMSATSGATQQQSAFLNSDVVTLVSKTVNGVATRVPTIFDDTGSAQLSLALKNPGTVDATGTLSPTTATPLNAITISRYHVRFVRADGRNREGVDVPYAFDGGVTGVIDTTGGTLVFELVRHQMKLEPPLINLANSSTSAVSGAGEIATIAEITFYGRDQVGHEVSVTGTITVNFGDFGDP
jgi:hypothetical protein